MVINTQAGSDSGAGVGRFVAIGLAAALSGTLLRWLQGLGETNFLITALLYLIMTLLPAIITYFLLARDQERKLREVSRTLGQAVEKLNELKRVVEIEKNYYANERLLNVERRVLEATGSSMMEVAELVSVLNDQEVAHIKLKERFRVHAKSILTFRRAFQFELEQNFKHIGQVENEFRQMPHDERDEVIFETGRTRTEKLSQRYDLGSVAGSIRLLTEQSTENAQLASDTHENVVQVLDAQPGSAE